jgi:hypothetical protein
VNIFSKWIQKRKEKVEASNQEYWEAHKLSEKLAFKDLHQFREDMLKKLCPVNSMYQCTNKCIHFHRGGVADLSSPDEMYPVHKVVKPYCKLWR